MLHLISRLLDQLETSSYKNKYLSSTEFFCICIINMVSRAAEIGLRAPSTNDEDGLKNSTGAIYATQGSIVKRNRGLEVLFSLVRQTGTFNPFEAISNVTGSKNYDRDRHGTHLLSYVEGCLFKLKLTGARPPQTIESLKIGAPSSPSEQDTVIAASLPDRSGSKTGVSRRKRGTSANAETQSHASRASGKRRQSTRYQGAADTDDEGEDED